MAESQFMFRGARTDNGEFVEGNLVIDKDGNYNIVEYANWNTHTFSKYVCDASSIVQISSDNLTLVMLPIGSLVIPPERVEALKNIIGFAEELLNEPSVVRTDDISNAIKQLNLSELLSR